MYEADRGPRHLVEVQRPAFSHANAREIEELRQQPRQAVALPHDQSPEELVVRVGALGPGELLDRRADGGERILDLVRQARRELRHRLQALGPQVQLLQALRVRDVGEDRRDPGCHVRGDLERRGGHPDEKRSVGPPYRGFHPHRAHAAARRRGHGRPKLGGNPCELRHDGPGAPLPFAEAQDLLGGGVAVQQATVRVHRDDPRGDVAQHVRCLEPDLAELTGQRLPLGPHYRDAAREVRGHRSDARE